MLKIYVVAAVIWAKNKKILITKRPDNKPQGGFWEFPGGKIERDETPTEGLFRELKEELAISVLEMRPFIKLEHEYPERSIILDVWMVEKFTGNARGNEGQTIAWVSIDQLNQYQFPEANRLIVDKLQTFLPC
ncbi:8-oxo-dGTP diphosphatase MutT [Porticoccus sp. Uisw_050_02]|uniref:8-oxo-dGTP diphosphatase MutT n=1 Tax=Porticoccus sp. Uisw_050_02 TaxID=3230978 RepID=UPI0001104C58